MKIARLAFAFIWIVLLWGMLGVILKIATVQTPDWQIQLMGAVGGMAMWLYVCFKEIE